MLRRRSADDRIATRLPRALAFLITALLAGLLPGPALAVGTGAITGVAYGPTGSPAAGIYVSACADTCEYTQTSATGAYTIGNLDSGSYRIVIDDYSGALPGGLATLDGMTVDPTQAALIAVDAVAVTFDVHIPAGHIISGTVTNQSMSGVADAFVSACARSTTLDLLDLWACGYDSAASDGTYSLAVLPGAVRVWAEDTNNVLASGYYAPGGYAYAYRQATVLTVGSADIAGISITLPPGAAISGTVTNAGGPVVAVLAEACRVADLVCRTTFTTSDGSYDLSGLPAGTYYVVFHDPSTLNPSGWYGATGFTADSGQAAVVTVGSSGVSGIDVTLPIGHLVTGIVRSPSGAPAIAEIGDCTSAICLTVATSAADGTYSANLAPGSHRLHVSDTTGSSLSGYYSTTGLANAAHATKLTIGSDDLTGINLKLAKVTGGVHPGTSHSGTFTASTVVRKGTFVTARFLVGKLFAGTKVSIMRSVKSSAGKWSVYKRVATVTVASNGYAYYSVKPSGYMAFNAGVTDVMVYGVTYLSPPVYARGK